MYQNEVAGDVAMSTDHALSVWTTVLMLYQSVDLSMELESIRYVVLSIEAFAVPECRDYSPSAGG